MKSIAGFPFPEVEPGDGVPKFPNQKRAAVITRMLVTIIIFFFIGCFTSFHTFTKLGGNGFEKQKFNRFSGLKTGYKFVAGVGSILPLSSIAETQNLKVLSLPIIIN
jgi:hypothetical protein